MKKVYALAFIALMTLCCHIFGQSTLEEGSYVLKKMKNSCIPSGCELVPNGDFEVTDLTNTETYDLLRPFRLNQVCGWQDVKGTPIIDPTDPNFDNHAYLWAGIDWVESIRTKQPIDLLPNTTYILEYDYFVESNTDHIFIKLAEENSMYQIGTEIDYLGNTPTSGAFQHRIIIFTTPTAPNDRYLTIYPKQQHSNNRAKLQIDNISIRPYLEVTATTDENSICENTCTQLHASAEGGDGILWEPSIGLDNPNSYHPTACPTETTTYIATIYDDETGCTTSKEVTIEVDFCTPQTCEDLLTVEGKCTLKGIWLTAYLNGVAIDSNSSTYKITWNGTTTDYMNQNPVSYPLGEAYTLKVEAIYELLDSTTLCCHYELDSIVTGVFEVNAMAERDTICQLSCTQLSTDLPEVMDFNINWTPIEGLDDSNSSSPIACPSQTTTYTANVSDATGGCTAQNTVTVFVEEDCACEDIEYEIVQECNGYDVVVKVLVDGIAIDPSVLDWIDINWDIVGGNDVIDENCITLPIGTEYEISITSGQDLNIPSQCCHYSMKGNVEDLGCLNCDFSIQETCDGDGGVYLTMVNSVGLPIIPGPNGAYTFDIVWEFGGLTLDNENPVYVSSGTTYNAGLFLRKSKYRVCGNKVRDYVAECCDTNDCCSNFNPIGVIQTYQPTSDILVSWDPNDAVSYEIDIEHGFTNCPTTHCHFEIEGGTTFISLAAEGCFDICHNYNITVTAICTDGTSHVVELPPLFTTPSRFRKCLACIKWPPLEGIKKGYIDNLSTEISLFPNPAIHALNIDYGTTVSRAHIQIFDFSGREVFSQETEETDKVLMDVTDLLPAVYMVKISIEGQGSVFKKVAIVK